MCEMLKIDNVPFEITKKQKAKLKKKQESTQ